ncbi:hypothetical protein T4D_11994 [Trichinella pseudospiralis]|uniref:Uncharacterized protein n=1 Tax=Trichinella pseudospiralis TaxID=6337 RepID=A0A0V1FBT6_TRIPS|nr:hypothetical protein T4D_11994 [Trichinella pseudospiralis]
MYNTRNLIFLTSSVSPLLILAGRSNDNSKSSLAKRLTEAVKTGQGAFLKEFSKIPMRNLPDYAALSIIWSFLVHHFYKCRVMLHKKYYHSQAVGHFYGSTYLNAYFTTNEPTSSVFKDGHFHYRTTTHIFNLKALKLKLFTSAMTFNKQTFHINRIE